MAKKKKEENFIQKLVGGVENFFDEHKTLGKAIKYGIFTVGITLVDVLATNPEKLLDLNTYLIAAGATFTLAFANWKKHNSFGEVSESLKSKIVDR